MISFINIFKLFSIHGLYKFAFNFNVDSKSKYFFGEYWYSIGFVLIAYLKYFIFSRVLIFNNNLDFSIYVYVGFFVWMSFSYTILCATKVNSILSKIIYLPIKNLKLSLLVVILFSSLRHYLFLILGLFFLFLFVEINYFSFNDIPNLIIKIILSYLFIFSLILPISILCIKYTDLIEIITNTLRILFFLTPVFWYVNPGKFSLFSELLIILNPLNTLITNFRLIFIDKELLIYDPISFYITLSILLLLNLFIFIKTKISGNDLWKVI